MATVWMVLGLAGIAAASYAVLDDLRPPRPPKAKPVAPPKAKPVPPPTPAPKPVEVPPETQVTQPIMMTPVPPLPQWVVPAAPAAAAHTPKGPAPTRVSMLETLTDVEHDEAPPGWRRASAAVALLVMTLLVAAATGAGIYRGLLALKG
jgi:hypothetical protein